MILLNAAESRELDRLSQEKFNIPSYSLMRRAGEAVADLLLRRWPSAAGSSVLVVAGKGNNGGDGLVAARKLMQVGVRPRVILLARVADLKGDAARAHGDYVAAGGIVAEVTSAETSVEVIGAAIHAERPVAVVDAIFGTGLNAEVRGLSRVAIEAINLLGVPVVAVDIASGVNADSGAVMGAAVVANLTVTFGHAKYGQVSYPGAEVTGDLEIVDIGFAPAAIEEIAPHGRMIEAMDAAEMLTPRSVNSHKGTYGHPLIIAGSRGKSGAAILAARGALRMGAGLVTAAIPESIAAIAASGQPELMTEPMPDRDGHFAALETLDQLKSLVTGMSALVAGPGIGVSDDTRELITWLVEEGAQPQLPLLIDADGLNLLAALGPALLKSAHGPIVLTPHPGEMGRLLGISTAAVNADRIGAARRLADTTGAGVLLKGARTIVVTPDGRVLVNSSGNPGMATPGMGDVLSGMIGALLGQGMDPGDALALGAFVHGLAADCVVVRLGPIGYLAGDLAAELPVALASLVHRANRNPH
jgi:ADP-dependent NAD(P)H-hydrate dehydratase / NAD(P)H-hydrate epimerase